jgi:hypothetical protein
LWDKDLKERGPRWKDALQAGLPEVARLGFKDVFTHGVWTSVTSDPERREGEGNICCPYEFTFAEAFGGSAGMKELVDAAHAAGLAVYQWFGFQMARYAPVWKEHPGWLLREQNGDPWDGRYDILWCGRMRSGFREWLMQQVKAVRDETGMDGIFYDSYQNLGVTCVDWQAPDKAPQADEIWEMQAELQRHGYRFRCEVVTIFGVTQVSMYGFEDDAFRRRLWDRTVENDDAFALLDCSPGFFCNGTPFTPERVSPERYFWLAGHRCVPGMGYDPWHGSELPGGEHAAAYARVNRLYNEVLPDMSRLRVTAEGKYTVWHDAGGRPAVVWAFADSALAFKGKATRVDDGASLSCKDTLALEAGQVYRLAGK